MNVNTFSLIQIVLSIILVGLILLQAKGTGLGSTFGGELAFYRSRRGFEKLLFYITGVVAGLFLISSVVRLIL